MPLTFTDVQKDSKAFGILKTYMTAQHNVENYDFLQCRDGNDKLYSKYVSAKSSTQVNLKGGTQSGLDALANQKNFKGMDTLMKAAKAEILSMINMDVLPRFESSKDYKDYLTSKAPKAAAPAAVAPKPAAAAPKPAAAAPKPAAAAPVVDLTAAKAAVTVMEKDITDGTTFLTTATNTVKSKGVPANRDEVNRMFDSGRMRHDKVQNAFTALVQKDKAFTRQNFGAFFIKKDAFSKLWGDYRKLLGK